MRRFGEPQHVQLVGLFTRAQRLRLFGDRADWRFLLGVAWNLAFMTARMHYDNLVIGDFSSSNVVVDANGFVTFLDCDSIAFTDPVTGEPFPCLMHTTDYSSPERQSGAAATEESDNFALAVLIYQLLTASTTTPSAASRTTAPPSPPSRTTSPRASPTSSAPRRSSSHAAPSTPRSSRRASSPWPTRLSARASTPHPPVPPRRSGSAPSTRNAPESRSARAAPCTPTAPTSRPARGARGRR